MPKVKCQILPNLPLLRGGQGGLLIDFGLLNLFNICLPALYQHGSGPIVGRDFEIWISRFFIAPFRSWRLGGPWGLRRQSDQKSFHS